MEYDVDDEALEETEDDFDDEALEETEDDFESAEGARVNVSHCNEIGSVAFVEAEVGSGDSHCSTSEAFVRSKRSWNVRICKASLANCLRKKNIFISMETHSCNHTKREDVFKSSNFRTDTSVLHPFHQFTQILLYHLLCLGPVFFSILSIMILIMSKLPKLLKSPYKLSKITLSTFQNHLVKCPDVKKTRQIIARRSETYAPRKATVRLEA